MLAREANPPPRNIEQQHVSLTLVHHLARLESNDGLPHHDEGPRFQGHRDAGSSTTRLEVPLPDTSAIRVPTRRSSSGRRSRQSAPTSSTSTHSDVADNTGERPRRQQQHLNLVRDAELLFEPLFFRHLPQWVLDAGGHRIERSGQLTELIPLRAEIPRGNRLGGCARSASRASGSIRSSITLALRPPQAPRLR